MLSQGISLKEDIDIDADRNGGKMIEKNFKYKDAYLGNETLDECESHSVSRVERMDRMRFVHIIGKHKVRIGCILKLLVLWHKWYRLWQLGMSIYVI